jgi:hypothetical protein
MTMCGFPVRGYKSTDVNEKSNLYSTPRGRNAIYELPSKLPQTADSMDV